MGCWPLLMLKWGGWDAWDAWTKRAHSLPSTANPNETTPILGIARTAPNSFSDTFPSLLSS